VRRLIAAALVLAATGCSLPLSHDTTTVGEVTAERRQKDDIQVLPPGPKSGQGPEDIVQGFLGAQANAADGHAIARQFLTPGGSATWRDDVGVKVYDPEKLGVQQLPGGTATQVTVQVSSVVSAEVLQDGSYTALAGAPVHEEYSLRRDAGGWRLVRVPAGLRLTAADLARSYEPSTLYYLAPKVTGTAPHLVPDQVFLPAAREPVNALVRRLLAPPSTGLGGSAYSAFPPGVTIRTVSISGAGVVTVDASAGLLKLDPDSRQSLSAQLIWTLRGLGPAFTGLRLLTEGTSLPVPTEGQVQDAGDWSAYDPEGLGPNPAYYFVAARRLRASVALASGPATVDDLNAPGSVPVDQVAVTPDRTQVALLAGTGGGQVTVRTGPLRGPTYTRGPTARGLTSPTWGSGQYGLWMIQSHSRVVLLPRGGKALRTVDVGPLPAGRLSSLALSRDGARAALVVDGRLYIGRVVASEGVPSLEEVSLVLPTLSQVRSVAWVSGIELAVLGSLSNGPQVLRVAVDGSSVSALNSAGLTPGSVAASAAGLLVTSRGVLFTAAGRGFTLVQAGSAPAFPG
jgi:hypothetical protein